MNTPHHPTKHRALRSQGALAERAWASWLAVAALTFAMLGAAPPSSATAELPGTLVVGGTTFSAYVGDGESLNTDFSKFRDAGSGSTTTFRITDASGAEQSTCTVAPADPNGTSCDAVGLTGPAGAWTIEVIASDGQAANWPEGGTSHFDWAISVQDGAGTDIPGRVWTEKYRGYDESGGSYDIDFWVATEHGSKYKVDLNSFTGFGWAFDSTAFGVTDSGTCTPRYESIEMTTNTPEYPGAADSCGDPYKLFFEPPAADLPATAPTPTGTDWINSPVVTPQIDGLQFATDGDGTRAGTFTYDLVDFTGAYELQIDANGDGDYDDPEDVVLPFSGRSGSQAHTWDGVDGLGNSIDACRPVNARVQIDRVDEIHFVLGDVEALGGMTIEQLAGNAPGESVMYWDDRAISGNPPTPIIDGRAGVESDVPGGVHGWPNGSDSWGNQAAIDNWTFSPVDISQTIALDSCDDFGDAPDSYGTALADDGPYHGPLDGLTLGAEYDVEPDGLPSADAAGDDADGTADEDGVAGPVYVAVGEDNTVGVTATNDTAEPATLAGWVDLDNSGTFDAGELVTVPVPAGSGTVEYPLTFPGATVTGDSFARFRLYAGTPDEILPTGGWASGEVEDYLVHLYSTEVVKEPVGEPVANADGTHTVQFRITVAREGTGPDYDLDDTFTVGDAITVNSVTSANVSPGGISTLDQWDPATGVLQIVEDEPIAAGATHEYVVTMNATVDGETLTFESSDCSLEQSEEGTGFLNTATVTTDGNEIDDQACQELSEPTHDKSVTSEPKVIGDGVYEVEYTIEVVNEGAAVSEYTLDDELEYSDAVTVVDTAVSATPGSITPKGNWNGRSKTRLVTDQAIGAGTASGPAVHSYVVTVQYRVADGATSADRDCRLGSGEDGTGLLNTSTMTVNGEESEDDACVAPPLYEDASGGEDSSYLPDAGGPSMLLLGLGLALLGGGGLMVALTRRRRSQGATGGGDWFFGGAA